MVRRGARSTLQCAKLRTTRPRWLIRSNLSLRWKHRCRLSQRSLSRLRPCSRISQIPESKTPSSLCKRKTFSCLIDCKKLKASFKRLVTAKVTRLKRKLRRSKSLWAQKLWPCLMALINAWWTWSASCTPPKQHAWKIWQSNSLSSSRLRRRHSPRQSCSNTPLQVTRLPGGTTSSRSARVSHSVASNSFLCRTYRRIRSSIWWTSTVWLRQLQSTWRPS